MFYRSLPAAILAIALALACLVPTAEARSRKFSCPLPDKQACMSTEQVYHLTENGQDLDPNEHEEGTEHDVRRRKRQSDVEPGPLMVARPVEPVGGTPVAAPNRCCAPLRTEVTVKGDTLAVASPGPAYAPSTATPAVYGAVDTPTRGYAANLQPVAYAPPRANEMVIRTSREEPFRANAQVMRIFIAPWEDEQGDLHMGGYVFSEIAPRRWTVGARPTNANSEFRLLSLNSPARDAAQDAKTDQGAATARVNRSE